MQEIKGGCLCGSVRYEGDGQPMLTAACHCPHCQKQSGSAFSVNLMVALAAFRVSGETLGDLQRRGRSGMPVKRHFCASCGSPIYTEMGAMPGVVAVKAGTLDDRPGPAPGQHVVFVGAALGSHGRRHRPLRQEPTSVVRAHPRSAFGAPPRGGSASGPAKPDPRLPLAGGGFVRRVCRFGATEN